MTWRGEVVVSIPPGSAADGPVYQRPMARPAELGRAGRRLGFRAGPPVDGQALRATCWR
jgi:hypothetical protein